MLFAADTAWPASHKALEFVQVLKAFVLLHWLCHVKHAFLCSTEARFKLSMYLRYNICLASAGSDSKGFLDLAHEHDEGWVDPEGLCDVAMQYIHGVQHILVDF